VSDSPRASVVVVTKNRAASLARTLKALRRLDHPDYEVVVVDHGSTDETAEVADRFGVRRVPCPAARGIAGCRQLGAEAATGEIVAMCDDDCVPAADWLTRLCTALADPAVGMVGGEVINHGFPSSQQSKGRTRAVGPNGRLTWADDPAAAEFFGNANLGFRRSDFLAVGGYDTFFHTGAEIDLALTFREHGYRVIYEPTAVVDHYFTGVSFKRNRLLYGSQLMRLYRHLKHDRPRSPGAWARFWKDEAGLLGADLGRTARGLASAAWRRDRRRLAATAIDLFNVLSARVAVPWVARRARAAHAARAATRTGP
jgi:GT2 family glycosyltransferase